MKLTAFQYGKTEITEKMAFPDGNPDKKLPISLLFFLVETGDRKILIDVGCDTMPGFPLYEFQKPVEVLEKYKIRRESITDVVLTHAHHDHIDGVRHYNNATVFLQESEWNRAKQYLVDCKEVILFQEKLSLTDEILVKRIGGHTMGSCIVLIQNHIVLCGDECYTRENLSQRIPTGSSECPKNSISFVEEYRKECYRPILFHDPDLVGKIGFCQIV
ncbi:MAG: MBL fold metallo-hydrolase [Ruminococcaceae bacterium]|nr:MBL fold metallo-hydrolase [Oscillospiraceae bacterium]